MGGKSVEAVEAVRAVQPMNAEVNTEVVKDMCVFGGQRAQKKSSIHAAFAQHVF
jgi:hypothetical protein